MVNDTIVGRFTGPPYHPQDSESNRKIPDGPLFLINEVQEALDKQGVRVVTRDCKNDLQQLEFDLEDLISIVSEAIKTGTYKDSEWALIKNDGERRVWVACDAYVLRRNEWVKTVGREMPVEYYLKFSLSNYGEIVLTVSCHV